MSMGACSRGYKLRLREGEYPKSLSVVVSCECSVCVCGVGFYDFVVIVDPYSSSCLLCQPPLL
jgi:hypothetical protein